MIFKDDFFSNNLGYYFPAPLRTIGYFIIAGCIAAAAIGSFFPLLLLPVAVVLIFTKRIFEIDFINKQSREASSLFGFISGGWTPLPEFEYVSVFRARVASTMNSRISQSTIRVEEVQVNLVYPKNKKIEAANFENTEKAFAAARYFSQKLDLKILDATQKPFVWLEQ